MAVEYGDRTRYREVVEGQIEGVVLLLEQLNPQTGDVTIPFGVSNIDDARKGIKKGSVFLPSETRDLNLLEKTYEPLLSTRDRLLREELGVDPAQIQLLAKPGLVYVEYPFSFGMHAGLARILMYQTYSNLSDLRNPDLIDHEEIADIVDVPVPQINQFLANHHVRENPSTLGMLRIIRETQAQYKGTGYKRNVTKTPEIRFPKES